MNQAINNPAQFQKMQNEKERSDAIRTADVIDQMDTPKGRRYVWQVLKTLGYQTAITDTNAGVYGKVAKQAVAVEMVREMKCKCRDLFYAMEIENDGLGN